MMRLDRTDSASITLADESGLSFGSPALHGRKVTAAWDGGRLASDSGMRLFGQAERRGECTDHTRLVRLTGTLVDIY